MALIRSMGWVKLSCVSEYPIYEEMRQVMVSKNTLTFDLGRPSAHRLSDEDLSLDEAIMTWAKGLQPLIRSANKPERSIVALFENMTI